MHLARGKCMLRQTAKAGIAMKGFSQMVGISATTIMVCVLGAGLLQAAEGPVAKQPNIVFLLTDDQGYGDLSCHGNPILKTPNLDRLHAEAVRFTDFHVSPTCSPTRSPLLTGR